MNVLFITNTFPPSKGGSASNYEIFTSELVKRENIEKITVVSKYIKTEKVITISEEHNFKILRLLVDYKSKSNQITKFFFFIIQNIQCFFIAIYLRIIKKYDLIQTHGDMLWAKNGTIIQPGVFFLSKSGKNTILDIRDKLSLPTKDLNYSHYLVNSEYCFKALKKVVPEYKVSLAYSPFKVFDKEILSQNNDYIKRKPYIAFIGSVSENKGIFELISAMKILKENNRSQYKLLFCGELVDPIGMLPDNCEFLGSLDYLNAMKLLIGSDLLILPSKSESHPRVIVEAILYNIPFLTTRGVTELEKYFPKNMLDNIEPEYLAERIEHFYHTYDQNNSNPYPTYLHQVDFLIDQINKIYTNLN